MPNVNPLFQNLSLDPAEMITVNEAYDLACQTLQNIGQLEVDREIIARGILRGAKSGERERQQTLRACYPWTDRVRLPAA